MSADIYLSFRGVGDPTDPGYVSFVDLAERVTSDIDNPGVTVCGAGVFFGSPHPNRDIDVKVLGGLAEALTAVGEIVRNAAELDWLLSDLRWELS